MCLVAGEAAYCLRQGLYTGLVLQICRTYPDSMTRRLYIGLVLQICRAYPDSMTRRLYIGLVLQICRAYPDSMTRRLYIGLVLQICGAYPDSMTRCAQLLQEQTSVDFIDINCGCPIDLVFKKVCCWLQIEIFSVTVCWCNLLIKFSQD